MNSILLSTGRLARAELRKHFSTRALPTAAAIGLTNAPGPDPGRVLSPAAAGLVLAGYAVALLPAAACTTMRRDVA
jgi:hypothetical protein